jgi:hypothetical protein
MDALLTSTYVDPGTHILTLRIASRHNPRQEPYAVVPRVRICAGRQVTSVPTATNLTYPSLDHAGLMSLRCQELVISAIKLISTILSCVVGLGERMSQSLMGCGVPAEDRFRLGVGDRAAILDDVEDALHL